MSKTRVTRTQALRHGGSFGDSPPRAARTAAWDLTREGFSRRPLRAVDGAAGKRRRGCQPPQRRTSRENSFSRVLAPGSAAPRFPAGFHGAPPQRACHTCTVLRALIVPSWSAGGSSKPEQTAEAGPREGLERRPRENVFSARGQADLVDRSRQPVLALALAVSIFEAQGGALCNAFEIYRNYNRQN